MSALAQPRQSRVVARLSAHGRWDRGPVQLLVLESFRGEPDAGAGASRLWLRVALPRRPNGGSAWIPADYAQLSFTRWRLRLSTGKRRLDVYNGLRLMRSIRVVVGAPATPTPYGLFAINEKVRQPNPHGFYGPWALHLNAFSNVFDSFDGGSGVVAIHGRGGASLNDPLGSARSHGCIRISNTPVAWLARVVPLGTPVTIVP